MEIGRDNTPPLMAAAGVPGTSMAHPVIALATRWLSLGYRLRCLDRHRPTGSAKPFTV